MINSIRRFFDKQLCAGAAETPGTREHRLRLASAALMFELLTTDRHIDEREIAVFKSILMDSFNLNTEELDNIIQLAEEEAKQAVSLYEFTSLINESYQYEDKLVLIENMWRLALADQHLDKYEEQLIRKTADLIYVSHGDFIKLKLKVRDTL
ncbi:MAG: TerB family tellurite resistance protein [Pseudohongiella sp.]|nr:TerB family tellurite resistance protein [Pseudohongiella sp.]MDP2126285.1 TerB family tellurite resistance protein [Pseudohongiella sp.]